MDKGSSSLMQQAKIKQLFCQFKQDLIAAKFAGDIDDSLVSQVLNATDNSIYEVIPLAVISPKKAEDVELLCKIAAQKNYQQLTFTPRGGGTGTNGQALSSGIVVDMSRYLTKIVAFDKENQTVSVEPGVILSNLNSFLAPSGLFFAPHVSTENRATIGGMIANDSAGKGSLVYGKTSDYILELTCILIDGTKLIITPQQLDDIKEPADKLTNLAKQVHQLLLPVQDEIKRVFPVLSRPLSGYNLSAAVAGNVIDLAKIITGSEGTLAFITQAKLKLLAIPKLNALLVTHYNSFLEALDDGVFLIKHKPLAVETVDEIVQQGATRLPTWDSLAQIMGVDITAKVVSNFTEFVAETKEALEFKLAQLECELKARNTSYKIVRNQAEISQLWNMRALAVGLVGRVALNRKPIAFVEDAIVPPHSLRNFVAEFKAILDSHKLNYAMYGHSDVGCIHVRPALDLALDTDKQLLRVITNQVLELTAKYGGLLWGEHGKGFRGEFVAQTFGEILYPVLQKIKALFDPLNRMNPGKLVTPYKSSHSIIKIDEVTLRADLDKQISHDLATRYAQAMLCNGNAACFNQDLNNVMCPSYKVTQLRQHSPKGRAMLLKEWLRNKARYGNKHILTVAAATATYHAMQGCLGCKGCAGKCPTLVSIPDLRANFYHDYHTIYGKKGVKTRLLNRLEDILLVGSRYPKLWNLLAKSGLSRLVGMVNLPNMSINQPLKQICQQHHIRTWSKDSQKPLPLEKVSLVILLDVFTGCLNHELLLSTCNVLKHLGCEPLVILPMVSGKAFITYGEIEHFNQIAQDTIQLLAPVFAANIPVMSLENSIALLYRDEYTKFVSSAKLGGQVSTLVEGLVELFKCYQSDKVCVAKKDYYLLPHCSEQAICPTDAKLWQQLFKQFNLNCNVLNLGCCGLSGGYGHQAENVKNSQALFKMNWQPSLTKASAENIFMATGYSCRTQVSYLSNLRLIHPIQELERILIG
jgi:FAD/FMN-containing dehydrogenase/Fe-S oxidoreductase